MANYKIMIVEDEFIVRMDIQSHLESLGYEVPWSLASGEDAVALAKETRPDLILMDIKLKGKMDGIQAARKILSKYHIPVIFLSAYRDKSTLKRINTIKSAGYLSKPINDYELCTLVKKTLT